MVVSLHIFDWFCIGLGFFYVYVCVFVWGVSEFNEDDEWIENLGIGEWVFLLGFSPLEL